MSFYPFEFEAAIARHSMGTNARGELFYTVIYVPASILEALGDAFKPKLRVEGEIADIPFNAALMPSRGQVYIMAPKAVLSQIEPDASLRVEVRFRIANQDAVDMPADLELALQQSPEAQSAWDALTPGKRRGLAYRVASAKTPATIQKRIAEVFDALGIRA